MNINELKQSKYLKKEDAGQGKLVTINRIEQANVAPQGQAPEIKPVLFFNENIAPGGENKGMVMGWTNLQLCAVACGTEETDEWPGKQIVIYNDPSISFGNKITGGIRIRAPRQQTQQYATQPPMGQQPTQQTATNNNLDDFSDDIPF